MSKSLLLSNKFKKIGWMIFIPSLVTGLCLAFTGFEPGWLSGKMLSVFPSLSSDRYFAVVHVNFVNTIVGLLFISGGLLVGFLKEKNEDEYIARLRLASLLWAVLVNYILLSVAFVFIYDTAFLSVMIYNMFTVLLIFIVRFNYILFRNSKSLSRAE